MRLWRWILEMQLEHICMQTNSTRVNSLYFWIPGNINFTCYCKPLLLRYGFNCLLLADVTLTMQHHNEKCYRHCHHRHLIKRRLQPSRCHRRQRMSLARRKFCNYWLLAGHAWYGDSWQEIRIRVSLQKSTLRFRPNLNIMRMRSPLPVLN